MKQACTFALLAIILLQWLLLAYVLTQQHLKDELSLLNDRKDFAPLVEKANSIKPSSLELKQQHDDDNDKPNKFDGVAATLILKSPKWFQRRLTVMVQNVLNSIPPTWAVQIFLADHAQAKDGINVVNRGLQRLINSNPRVILTNIPTELWSKKQRPKLLLTDSWIWEHMIADNVFLFSGNGAVCANSHSVMEDFTSLDYVGIPWWRYDRVGGDGSTHSFRNRLAILDALRYTTEGISGSNNGKPYDGNEREDIFY
eukprot:5135917-Ditylum_brightwellii.AAC.1